MVTYTKHLKKNPDYRGTWGSSAPKAKVVRKGGMGRPKTETLHSKQHRGKVDGAENSIGFFLLWFSQFHVLGPIR